MNEDAEMLQKLVVSESSQKYSYYDFTLTMTFLIFFSASFFYHQIFSLCYKNAHKIEFSLIN